MLMDTAAYLIAGAMLLLAVAHVVGGSCYAFMLFRHRRVYAISGYAPPAAVIMALRGSDPSLERTLRGLSQQN